MRKNYAHQAGFDMSNNAKLLPPLDLRGSTFSESKVGSMTWGVSAIMFNNINSPNQKDSDFGPRISAIVYL